VQYVIRPNQDFRGFAGQIASGTVRPGQEIAVLPSGRRTRVKTISTFDGDLESAFAPMSVTLTFEDEIDVSRGDLLAGHDDIPSIGRSFDADIVWMSETPLEPSRPLLLKHASQVAKAHVREVEYRINMQSLDPEAADTLGFNDIGRLRIETAKPVYFDPYRVNRITGSFVLIDPATNATIAAGMILHTVERETQIYAREWDEAQEPVTPGERMARYRHFGGIVRFGDRIETGYALERRLFDEDRAAILLPAGVGADTAELLRDRGFIVLQAGDPGIDLPKDDVEAAELLYQRLRKDGVFVGSAQ
jgi:hypothetical protein